MQDMLQVSKFIFGAKCNFLLRIRMRLCEKQKDELHRVHPCQKGLSPKSVSSSQSLAFSCSEKNPQNGNILSPSVKLEPHQGPLPLTAQDPAPPAPIATCLDSGTRMLTRHSPQFCLVRHELLCTSLMVLSTLQDLDS